MQSRGHRVANKIALVTGASAGLGRAIAMRLAEEGATLVMADIEANGLAETERMIRDAGGTATSVVADVTEEAPVKALFAGALAAHGRIDILVNDVGGGSSGRIWEAKAEDWDFIIRLNLRSAFLCTREAAAHMRERRSGRIINLSSGSREGTPWTAYYMGNSAYSAAKAGIHGFTRGVALELAEYGVTVNAVAPGPIETEKTGPGFRQIEHLEYGPIRATPLRRIGVPADIANAVLYLASDEANYVTGTTLAVAGGR
ncbi:SDR family NAD(P)-dependent oxidoreductase [Reyranella sp.]|uniref:SDR family NAD(P)-dependent oxidoreductase n=1 Tax=Reyranella sp. TaxID=1929291 RepID=UPI003BAD79BB